MLASAVSVEGLGVIWSRP